MSNTLITRPFTQKMILIVFMESLGKIIMQPKATSHVNLLTLRRHYTNPHTHYHTLRTQGGICFDASSQSWLVTEHRIITAILDHPSFVSRSGAATNTSSASASISPISRQMLFLDGEPHRRAQEVMLRPLALLVKSMPEEIRGFARTAVEAARKKGEMEVVNEFASPISLLTIAHALGIPTHDVQQLRQLENWSDTFGDVTSGYFRGRMQDISDLEEYFRQLITEKRHNPSHDLLSAFVTAGDVFPDEEDLVANCMMVFAAGRITTKKLLGNAISLLLPAWEQWQKKFQADARFPRQLSEELLRMITPTRYLIREASEDIDLSALASSNPYIQRGQRMLLFLEAADYDPAVFPQPEQFHPERRPNKHIAFGYGPHQCPGTTLARIEIQIALEEVLSLTHLQTKRNNNPVWNPNPNLGGFTSHSVITANSP